RARLLHSRGHTFLLKWRTAFGIYIINSASQRVLHSTYCRFSRLVVAYGTIGVYRSVQGACSYGVLGADFQPTSFEGRLREDAFF
ncbi:unnamed protein product, partial [Ectocarpus sp. 8 AP-2014]